MATTQQYTVGKCKFCGQRHIYTIRVEKEVPLFGGVAADKDSREDRGFTCPVTQKVFSEEVALPKGMKIVEVVPYDESASVSAATPAASETNPDYDNWIKESRKRGLDFSTTMLSTSTGAIGIYFAIEKYLGVEKIKEVVMQIVSILPPVLYVTAAVFFVLALRPRFKAVTPSEFEYFRSSRLQHINRYNMIGVGVFLSATTVAVINFIILLRQG